MRPGNTPSALLKSSSQNPILLRENEGQRIIFTFYGQWRSLNISEKEQEFEEYFRSLTKNNNIHFIFAPNFQPDMAGSWIIGHFIYALKELGCNVSGSIPDIITPYIRPKISVITPPPQRGISHFIKMIGQQSLIIWNLTISLLSFFGEMVINILHSLKLYTRHRDGYFQGIRWVSVVHHLDIVGLQAVPLISLISFLIGAVLAYQGINQLTRFGAAIYTVDFLAISLLREIGVLITSIVVAGRSGSAFTAQIGTMVLNQEVDAIRMLGLDPMRVLIVPRIIAMVIALPLLVILSMILGAIGGMVICSVMIDLSPDQFFDSFQKAVSNSTFWVGISKAPLFALIISVIGCYRGMQVKGSAESVGYMTTQSVVESIFLVIVCDGLISIYFSALDL